MAPSLLILLSFVICCFPLDKRTIGCPHYCSYSWIISRLVVESLVNFQRKVAQIMKSVCFTLNDFDFVIHTFQFAGVDRIIAVIEDTVSISFQHPDEACHRWVL